MKKTVSVLGCVFTGLMVFLPLSVILFRCFGYRLTYTDGFAAIMATVTAAAAVVAAAIGYRTRISEYRRSVSVLFSLLAPLSQLYMGFYLFEYHRGYGFLCTLVAVIGAFWLSGFYGRPPRLKKWMMILAGLLMLPVGFFAFLMLTFGNIGKDTAVQTLESPGGVWRAEVIASDQGALGGDTTVLVYEDWCIDTPVFRLESPPQQVYLGKWGESFNMQLSWEDDGYLLINSHRYEIR